MGKEAVNGNISGYWVIPSGYEAFNESIVLATCLNSFSESKTI